MPSPSSDTGLSAADVLTDRESLLVLGPIRAERHAAWRRGDPVEVFDRLEVLVGAGLLTVLSRERGRRTVDVDLSKVGEGKVE